jgi:lipopolysaccharide export system protein LptA
MRSLLNRYSLIFFIYLSLIPFLFSEERLFLKQADLLESKSEGNKNVKYISGNIIFTKGDLTLKCQEGQQYEAEGIIILYKDVSSSQKDQSLTADTLKFHSIENRLEGIGNTHVWDENYDLVSDSITIFTQKNRGIASGNVILRQKGQIITADKIIYTDNQGMDGVSYIASGNVIIQDSSITSNSGKATYNRLSEQTLLEMNPSIEDQDRVLTGDKIELTYFEQEIKKIYIPNNANAITTISGYSFQKKDSLKTEEKLSFKNKMQGSQLTSIFKNSVLDSIKINGMAKTLYHVFEDSIYKGNNNVSGDLITIKFLKNRLKRLQVIGGSKGKYIPDSLSNEISSSVNYSSDEIVYIFEKRRTEFYGNAIINHDKTTLEAGYIDINWNTNLLNAYIKSEGDTINEPIRPIIKEKNKDPMSGDEMTYNLKTRKGKISKGNTKADDGFYTGKTIKNESTEVIYIENSTYTTCDLDTAHFHFESKNMKIIQDDIVVAKPIILHISQIPIFAIPFGIFPHKGGQRHSGWIMPSYGDNKNRGQYIQGLGFYWAPSQYWDSKMTMGFADRQGYSFRLNTTYRLRYKFSGSLNYFNQQFLSGTKDIMDILGDRNTSTTLRWNHKQQMRNNQSLNANMTYSTSGDYNKKYGISESERMNQKAISNISYSKRWPKSKNSLSLAYYSNLDLLIEDKTNHDSKYFVNPSKAGTQLNIKNQTFPKFSFRHGQSHLIPTNAKDKKWYNTITWNYGLNFTNTNRVYYESIQIDTSQYGWSEDSLLKNKKNEQNNGWIHTSSINAPQKIFKYISINPRLSLKTAWVNKTYDAIWDEESNIFQKIEENKFASRTTGSFSVNTSTQIYGLIPIPFGPLKSIRHVISPNIGYSWTPNFSKEIFGFQPGYILTKIDENGNERFHDRFAGTIAGSTPRSEQKSMTFSLNNIFQAKILKDDDEKKVDLLNWRINSGYNFAADSLHFSNIRSSLRSKILGKLNLDLSMTHDLYYFNTERSKRTSEYNRNQSGLITPRLVNTRLSTGFRIIGKKWNKEEDDKKTNTDTTLTQEDLAGPGLVDPLKTIQNSLKSAQLWSSNISLSYSYNALNPSRTSKTFWANTTSILNVTNNWKVSYRARFDLLERDLVNHSFSIYRDLHCWELSLNWTPNGIGQGINFRLNVKSPTLKDLKLEKKGGVYSGAGL